MAAGPRKRESHFAHRVVRLLHKSCAAQTAACYLVCVIAHTEDAARYSGPVHFWNTQLMETMGFTSPKQLDAARNKAIEAGWLNYRRHGTRSVGEYFVTIPERFGDLSDAPIEPRPILSSGGKNGGKNEAAELPGFFPDSTQIGDGKRNEKVTNSGKLPIPIPNPSPNTSHSRPVYEPEFEAFWQLYPAREGRKNHKVAAAKLWRKLGQADREILMQATANYVAYKTKTTEKPQDAVRFLSNDLWREFLEPEAGVDDQPSRYPVIARMAKAGGRG